MSNPYRTAQFLISVHSLAQLPPDEGREVAFAGRSNAGKSSALNALTDHKQLARISKTPGRTQQINFFQIAAERFLVDLPGYGYAKVPEPLRRHWQHTLARYLQKRQALQGLCLLMDIRHPLSPLDQQLLDWCAERSLPVHILLSKADKLKRGPAMAILHKVQQALSADYPQASVQLLSAKTGAGVAEAHVQLDRWLFPEPVC